MQHTVLARKYRPKDFEDLVGQTQSVTILKNIIQSDKLHHAYLLTGTRGVGKTTIARIISKALNCLALVNASPCKACVNCIAIDNGRLVDVIEIDAASNTGVDNVREIIENSQYAPTSGKYKIYIIDEVHMLSKSAFNAMLKTLEEPPKHVIFILATTDPQKIPITILSRCLQLKLQPISDILIGEYLAKVLVNEQVNYDIPAIELIAKSAQGSMRDGLSLLDQAIAFTNGEIKQDLVAKMLGITDDHIIIGLLEAIAKVSAYELINLGQTIINNGYNLEHTLNQLNDYLYKIQLEQFGIKSNNQYIQKLAQQLNVNNIQLYFEIINLATGQLTSSNNKATIFSMTLLRLLAFNIADNNTQNTILTNQASLITHPLTNPQPLEPIEQSSTINDTNDTVYIEITSLDKLAAKAIQESKSNSIIAKIPNVEQLPKPIMLETNNTATNDFNENWVDFIEVNKNKFDKHIYPIVENAKLVKLENNTLHLEIDQRYSSACQGDMMTSLDGIFTNLLNKSITTSITFHTKVDNTVKEKNINTRQQAQLQAELSIKQDAKLNCLIQQFSATIIPNSIKPV